MGLTILYGTAIQEAIASGDLNRMKKLAAQADAQVKKSRDVDVALKALKVEIAKLERRGRR